MKTEKCIMIIIKKRIQSGIEKRAYTEMDLDNQTLVAKDDKNQIIGKASLVQGKEYGIQRYKLEVECTENDMDLYSYLVSSMCVFYDSIPSKYPLYIVLDSTQIEQIKTLSRIGFTPYLGDTSQKSEEENKEIWQQITETLRQESES